MSWAVLTSTSGHELAARGALQALGVEAYCPIIRRITKPRRKSKPVEVIKAAFPRYLFADPSFTDYNKYPALMAMSLAKLSLGGAFCHVSDDEVARLRSEDDIRTAKAVEAPKLVVGDYVCITKGPLTGVEGTVTAVLNDRYELEAVGSMTRLQMPAFSVERAEGRSLQ